MSNSDRVAAALAELCCALRGGNTDPDESTFPWVPETAPQEVPETAPEEVPEAAPQAAPEAAPEPATSGEPEPAPVTAPETAPVTAPEATPQEATPQEASQAPQAARQYSYTVWVSEYSEYDLDRETVRLTANVRVQGARGARGAIDNHVKRSLLLSYGDVTALSAGIVEAVELMLGVTAIDLNTVRLWARHEFAARLAYYFNAIKYTNQTIQTLIGSAYTTYLVQTPSGLTFDVKKWRAAAPRELDSLHTVVRSRDFHYAELRRFLRDTVELPNDMPPVARSLEYDLAKLAPASVAVSPLWEVYKNYMIVVPVDKVSAVNDIFGPDGDVCAHYTIMQKLARASQPFGSCHIVSPYFAASGGIAIASYDSDAHSMLAKFSSHPVHTKLGSVSSFLDAAKAIVTLTAEIRAYPRLEIVGLE